MCGESWNQAENGEDEEGEEGGELHGGGVGVGVNGLGGWLMAVVKGGSRGRQEGEVEIRKLGIGRGESESKNRVQVSLSGRDCATAEIYLGGRDISLQRRYLLLCQTTVWERRA